MARINMKTMCQESDVGSTKIKSIPKLGGGLATAATVGTKSVDGGEDQRQEAAGDEEMIRRPRWQSKLLRGRRVSEKFPKKLPVAIYSSTLSM